MRRARKYISRALFLARLTMWVGLVVSAMVLFVTVGMFWSTADRILNPPRRFKVKGEYDDDGQ